MRGFWFKIGEMFKEGRMSHIKQLVLQFEHELRVASDLTNFFASANAQESLQIIIQQMGLEMLRRIRSNESLEELAAALRTIHCCLIKSIQTVPEPSLLFVLKNSASVSMLLFMVEHVQNPNVVDRPS